MVRAAAVCYVVVAFSVREVVLVLLNVNRNRSVCEHLIIRPPAAVYVCSVEPLATVIDVWVAGGTASWQRRGRLRTQQTAHSQCECMR